MHTIDYKYLELVNAVIEHGHDKQDRTGTGTRSLFGGRLEYDMGIGYPLLTTKKMAFKSIVTELLWFLRGSSNVKFLHENNCKIWDADLYKSYIRRAGLTKADPELILTQEEFINRVKSDENFAFYWAELGPIYPVQWRGDGWTRPDQLAQAIHLLKTDPDSRRIIIDSWEASAIDLMGLPPCHTLFQFYSHELANGQRQLDLQWYQRSADMFLGVPFNIASYGLLLKMVAKEVNMVPGKLMVTFGDMHVYRNHFEQVQEQMMRNMLSEVPEVELNYEGELLKVIETLTPDNFRLLNYNPHPAIKGEQSS